MITLGLRPLPSKQADGPQSAYMVLATHESLRRKWGPGYHRAQERMHVCVTLMVHVCSGSALPPAAAATATAPVPRPSCSSPSSSAAVPSSSAAPSSTSSAARLIRPPLALLIASHVPTEERLLRLREMLACVAAQRGDALSATFLSWSAEHSVRPAVRRAIYVAGVPGLIALEQPEALAQFEHYARLASSAASHFAELLGVGAAAASCEAEGGVAQPPPPPTASTPQAATLPWVCFADDDDLLHPDRSAAYLAAIEAAPANTRAVSAAWVGRPRDAQRPCTAAEVGDRGADTAQSCSAHSEGDDFDLIWLDLA